jgi:competence protein CoiA
MLLHALDQDGQIINARHASRQKNYYCLECRQTIRLRGGPQRRPHFYHFEPALFCRQHQKGMVHLQLQDYFLRCLPSNDCKLEHPFPQIRRIADVAWLSQKIVFEIQCSAISADEVLARNRDYQQEGWEVVWILHDQRYNQIRLSAAEMALRQSPHFFSNMDRHGNGIIYDQFDLWERGLRILRMPPLSIDIQGEIKTLANDKNDYPLSLMKLRAEKWKYSFAGDLMSSEASSSYLEQAIEKEKQFHSNNFSKKQRLAMIWQAIKSPYQIVFRFLLERMCR